MPKRASARQSKGRPRKSNKKTNGSNRALIIVVAVAAVVLLGGGSVAAYFVFRDKSPTTQQAYDPFAGMLAHWSFDGVNEGKVIDQTGRGNDGFLTGGRLAPGVKGDAIWLDGRDDQYCELKQTKDLNFAEGAELTIAAWYQTSDVAGTILAFRNSQRLTQLDLYVRDNHLLGIIGGDDDTGPNHAFVWCDPVNDGRWHHAALTRKGKFIQLFYDGVLVKQDANGRSGGPITGDMRYIGVNLKFAEEEKRLIPRIGFKGGIDEVYVFSRALEAHEIQKLMKR